MRGPAWVAVAVANVLWACGSTSAATGATTEDVSDVAVSDAATDAVTPPDIADGDAAADVAPDEAGGQNDGCGADACGADDIQPDAADAMDSATPDAAPDTLDCAAVLAQLQDGIALLQQGHMDCQHDTDCTSVSTTTACQGTCGVGLNVNFVDAFQKGLAALDDKFCQQTGFAAQCGYTTPKCIAPNPGCVDGQCVYKK